MEKTNLGNELSEEQMAAVNGGSSAVNQERCDHLKSQKRCDNDYGCHWDATENKCLVGKDHLANALKALNL